MPKEMDRAEMAREILRREAGKIAPILVDKGRRRLKKIIQNGEESIFTSCR